MKFANRHKPWIYIFAVLAAIVVVYKIIDRLDIVFLWGKRILDALNPFIIGFVIAYLINQPCNSVARLCRKTKIKFLQKYADGVGVLIVYLLIVIIFAIIMGMILPALYKNIVDLFNNLPAYFENGIAFINDIQDKLNLKLINTDTFSVENAVNFFITEVDLSQFGKYAEGIISATFGIFDVFVALIVSIYMCIDKKRISSVLKRVIGILFIKDHSENIFEYIGKINDIFSKYIYCKLIEAVIVTVLSTIILSCLNIEYALILGIMIGVLNLIPYFGSIISTILAVVITFFSTGPWEALWTGIALLILEQIDGNFIGPKIIGDMLDMRPLWVIFSVTVGGSLFGVLGMLLSVPIAMVIKMITKDLLLLRERQLLKEKNTVKDA